MSHLPTKATARLAAVLALLVLLLASQALAQASAPPSGTSSAGRSIGRTGFAYLGGLRTFGAAVLWNRIDPLLHEYYNGAPLGEQTYMMPTMWLVTTLDPQFEQAYYVASWIAFERLTHGEGIAIARSGVSNNPKSGLLRANLVQLLFIEGLSANRAEIEGNLDLILGTTLEWADEDEYYEGLAITVEPLKAVGRTELAEEVQQGLDEMRDKGVGAGDHDHDGDGVQDH